MLSMAFCPAPAPLGRNLGAHRVTDSSGWDAVVLQGPRLNIRLASEADVPALTAMLREPEVARWWGSMDEDDVRRQMAEEPTFVTEVDGRVMGILLCGEENDPEYRHAGLDISLHPDFHGRGYGQEALALVIDHLFRERGHHRITIDPAAVNAAAIRCYERVGFRAVGLMREYEIDRDAGEGWRDGLLMDLLKRDWRGPSA
jgi:aminoglycoside 6'-N-acetyltransferase